MARPCKSIEGQSRHNSKEEIEKRKEAENKLKGLADKIEFPPEYLSYDQKKIYKEIFEELKASQILSNLDVYILASCSIAIDRLQFIETIINKNPKAIMNKDLMSAKDKYNKDFYRCCNELSLSPQSRAKFGSLSLKAKDENEDAVIKALMDDEEDE
ncbi:phage terminase small subunit P27 family [Clostridium saudiense]|uniref:phage terminase small subunit P27 family n=1 Tax=Clostridium saudiense TaxID=1414720 RepID=UPI00319DB00F